MKHRLYYGVGFFGRWKISMPSKLHDDQSLSNYSPRKFAVWMISKFELLILFLLQTKEHKV